MARRSKANLPVASAGDYAVGYGKPPEHTRFTTGQSGNPRGRPKGSRNSIPDMKDERLKAIILEEAYRDIRVREGERSVTLPVIRAAVRTLANKGLKGETRSLKGFMELVQIVEEERTALWREYLLTMMEYKHDWGRELERRNRLGLTGLPEPGLHPDDVFIDPRSGDVRIVGPITREEIPVWEEARKEMRTLAEIISGIESRLQQKPDNTDLSRTLTRLRKQYDEYAKYIGPGREPEVENR